MITPALLVALVAGALVAFGHQWATLVLVPAVIVSVWLLADHQGRAPTVKGAAGDGPG